MKGTKVISMFYFYLFIPERMVEIRLVDEKGFIKATIQYTQVLPKLCNMYVHKYIYGKIPPPTLELILPEFFLS